MLPFISSRFWVAELDVTFVDFAVEPVVLISWELGPDELTLPTADIPPFSADVVVPFETEETPSDATVEVTLSPKLLPGFTVLPAAAETCVEETFTDPVTSQDAVEFLSGPSVVEEFRFGAKGVDSVCVLFCTASDLLTNVFRSSKTEEDVSFPFFSSPRDLDIIRDRLENNAANGLVFGAFSGTTSSGPAADFVAVWLDFGSSVVKLASMSVELIDNIVELDKGDVVVAVFVLACSTAELLPFLSLLSLNVS